MDPRGSARGTASAFCLRGHTPDSCKGPRPRGGLPEGIWDFMRTHKPYPKYLSLQTKGVKACRHVLADAGGDR